MVNKQHKTGWQEKKKQEERILAQKTITNKIIFVITVISIITILAAILSSAPTIAFSQQTGDNQRLKINNYEKATIKFTTKNRIRVTGRAKELTITMSWVPQNNEYQESDNQVITDPLAEVKKRTATDGDEEFVITYEPPASENNLELRATINRERKEKLISEKILFPNNQIPPEYSEYLLPGTITDITPEIRSLSTQLTSNTDDYYEAVFKIGSWVRKNIKYDLNTLTAEATQKSSWVLKNKEGVCDEITSLFISLLRSAGIPARFVSGMAYTNDPTMKEWGPHGWAEVYFPEKGWVPFDITYGEFGYLDVGHIILKRSKDSLENNMEYSLLGSSEAIMNSEAPSFKAEFQKLIRERSNHLGLSVTAAQYYDKVGPESYDLWSVKLTNKEPYYKVLSLQLSRTQGLSLEQTFIDGQVLTDKNDPYKELLILLKPRETKIISFLIRTGEVPEGYEITYPLSLYENDKEIATGEIKSNNQAMVFPKKIFTDYLSSINKQSPNNKIINNQDQLLIDCPLARSIINTSTTINCRIIIPEEALQEKNRPATNEQSMRVCSTTPCDDERAPANDNDDKKCVEGQVICEEKNMNSSGELMINRKVRCDKKGVFNKPITITAEAMNSLGSTLLKGRGMMIYSCEPEPKINIRINDDTATLVTPDTKPLLSISIIPVEGEAKNWTLIIEAPYFKKEFSGGETLQKINNYELTYDYRYLDEGDNKIIITTTYYDINGKKQISNKILTVTLKIDDWGDRLALFLDHLLTKINNLLSKEQ